MSYIQTVLSYIQTVLYAFAAAYLGTVGLFVIFDWEITKGGLWACIIVLTIVFMAIFVLFKGKSEGCPKCGKRFAMKETSRKYSGKKETTMDVERQVKNSKGEVVRSYTEAVPAVMRLYDCHDVCKYCGFERDVIRSDTVRK